MSNKIIIVLVLFFLTACSKPEKTSDIQKEYHKLAKDYDSKIKINSIKLLNSEVVDFQKLANFEVARMEEENIVRRRIVDALNKRDSSIKNIIKIKQNLANDANSNNEVMYVEEIKVDSSELTGNYKKKILVELEEAKNDLKILDIAELSRIPDIDKSENLMIKHKVDININDNRVIDTLIYFSFNNGKYSYLNKNLFIKNPPDRINFQNN